MISSRLDAWLRHLPADPPLAVVLGGQANGLSFVRSLGRRGIPTLMLCGRSPRSRYGKTVEMPDAVRQADRWVTALKAVAERTRAEPVLLPTSDPLVLLVTRHEESLRAAGCRFLLPAAPVTEAIVDKRAQYEHARRLGIPLPDTHFPESPDELAALSTTLRYPCILKPYQSHLTKGVMGAKALVAHDPAELRVAYGRYAHDEHRLMVQDFVPGGEDSLFGYVAFWDAQGREQSWITRQKLRQYPPRLGNGSLQVSVCEPEVAELGRRLIGSLEYRGPVAVEFKRDARDGTFRLIEINARTGASNQLGIDAGVDFPWIIYRSAVAPGEPLERAPEFRVGVRWIHEELDFRALRELRAAGELTVRDWFASVRGARSFAYWSPHDPMPLITRIGAYVRGLMRPHAEEGAP